MNVDNHKLNIISQIHLINIIKRFYDEDDNLSFIRCYGISHRNLMQMQ